MALNLSQENVSKELKSDNRDVADLWKDALKAYKGIVGFDLERKFDNVQAMINQGTKEMENFHKYRHNDKKVDKLRTLFAKNLDYIDKGAQMLIEAAVPAFPPAAAIGTAVTLMLGVSNACQKVSADYDIVMVFFEDMNSFLQRVVILETRLPKSKAYQNSLMDVFTSFLTMCGFAHKYIELGRFKKWISNLLQGEDSELGGARKKMDLEIRRLQEATEFAILGNTEETQKMTMELLDNQQLHTSMLKKQMQVMDTIQDTTETIRNDMAKLLKAFEDQKKEQKKDRAPGQKSKTAGGEHGKPPSAKGIRNTLLEVEGEDLEYHILKETFVSDTCRWIFREPYWDQWMSPDGPTNAVLAITGVPGSGKSHIGLAVYERLRQEVETNTTRNICAAHFYFREQSQSLSSFLNGITTIINQVAEQSPALCEMIYAELISDENSFDLSDPDDLARTLLGVAFSKTSESHLYLMLDGIDELDQSGRSCFKRFLDIIKEADLRISVVFTSRLDGLTQESDLNPFLKIEAQKEKQMDDLRAIVWNRISCLGALKKFGRYVQQLIAEKIEDTAPNILYAEHLLGRLNALGREGAVIRFLKRPLPPTLHELYEVSVEECFRRTESSHREIVSKLLYWTSFYFRPITLDEVISLLRFWADDENFDLEDIPEPFSKLLQVGDLDSDAEARAKLQTRGGWGTDAHQLENAQKTPNTEVIYNDGGLPVKFRERSMRGYFVEELDGPSRTHLRPSEVHRRIFLECTRLAWPKEFDQTKIDGRLRGYAVNYLVAHFRQINLEQHDVEEQAKVMEAFALTMLNRKSYAMMQELHGANYEANFTEDLFERLAKWSLLLERVRPELSPDVAEWWDKVAERPRDCLIHLAKAHLRRLYDASDVQSAWVSYMAFKMALKVSHKESMLVEQAKKNFALELGEISEPLKEKQGALGLEGLFEDVEIGSTGHRSIASLLIWYRHTKPAESTCQKAIERNQICLERVRSLELMARIRRSSNPAAAYEDILACLEYIRDDTIEPWFRRLIYVTKARIETKLGKLHEAAKSYAQARIIDPKGLATGDALEGELDLFANEPGMKTFMDTLKSWSPLERLTWLCWKYDDQGHERSLLPLDAAVKSGEAAFMIQVHEESIKYLDNVNAAAPLRVDLAYFYIHVQGDLEAARSTLDEALNSGSTGWPYAVTEQTPYMTLDRANSYQSEVLYRLFRGTSDFKRKAELLAATEVLLTRPLALDVPPVSKTSLLFHQVILARMYLKMGPITKFHETLQEIIHAAVDALGDKVGWNDWENLMMLVTSLCILAGSVKNGQKLRRAAQILQSAQFCHLDPIVRKHDEENGHTEEDEEEGEESDDDEEKEEPPTNEGDLDKDAERCCYGDCEPRVSFSWWGDRNGYQCLVCYDCFLCSDCYDKKQAGTLRKSKAKATPLCGDDHEYIKGPIVGWNGVVDGKIMIEGEEPVVFSEFLRHIREDLCKEAWDSFWKN